MDLGRLVRLYRVVMGGHYGHLHEAWSVSCETCDVLLDLYDYLIGHGCIVERPPEEDDPDDDAA